MLRYLSLDIICSSKLTVFLELRSRKTVRFSEQITSADKYLSIFSRQMEAIVYITSSLTTHVVIPTLHFTSFIKLRSHSCEPFQETYNNNRASQFSLNVVQKVGISAKKVKLTYTQICKSAVLK